jgi:hypothetical protein
MGSLLGSSKASGASCASSSYLYGVDTFGSNHWLKELFNESSNELFGEVFVESSNESSNEYSNESSNELG